MRTSVSNTIVLFASVVTCGCGSSALETAPFGIASHTRIEGEVTSLSGAALPGVLVNLSLTPEVVVAGYSWNVDRTDGNGKFHRLVERRVGEVLQPGRADTVLTFVVATAPSPPYQPLPDGTSVRDSVPVRLVLVGPRESPRSVRATIRLPVP